MNYSVIKNIPAIILLFTAFLCLPADFSSAAVSDVLNGESPFYTTEDERDQQADRIVIIDTIKRGHEILIAAYKEKLEAEQTIFNERLDQASTEEMIRNAFAPVAQAMEDMTVHQIQIAREINAALLQYQQLNHDEEKAQFIAKLDAATRPSLHSGLTWESNH